LAYALRANDYRGQVQLQLEWVDARSRGPVQASFELPRREVVDWREESDPGALLTGLRQESEETIVVWAEGGDQGTDRMNLAAASILVIWTAPPGPSELEAALQIVRPDTVYVMGHFPQVRRFRPFVERVAGMVKHDLRTRGGRVDVPRLAAALAHRQETVRAGLAWLAACGQIGIVEEVGDVVIVRAGSESMPHLADVQAHLHELLEETAAYRRHWRSAPIEGLAL
jgi:hypothetical protein